MAAINVQRSRENLVDGGRVILLVLCFGREFCGGQDSAKSCDGTVPPSGKLTQGGFSRHCLSNFAEQNRKNGRVLLTDGCWALDVSSAANILRFSRTLKQAGFTLHLWPVAADAKFVMGWQKTRSCCVRNPPPGAFRS